MGARLVAASVPLYALGVAVAVFLAWQPSFQDAQVGGPYYGGIAAFLATAVLVSGAAVAREFSRRKALIALGITAAFIAELVLAVVTQNVLLVVLFYWLVFFWFYLVQVALVAYPILFAWLWNGAPRLASNALKTGAPFSIGVLLAPVALGPRYFSDATVERNWAVATTATLLALVGAVGIAVGIPTLRLSWRSVGVAFAAVVIVQLALLVRGLPNPPMALATAPLVTIEYPIDRPDLASDAPIFSDRLALILHRSGSTLPVGGVYVRYRWAFGPEGAPPPKDVLVLTVAAEGAAVPAHRLRNFAEKVTVKLVPEPLPRSGGAYDPWLGYIEWIFAPDEPATGDRLVNVCEWLVNKHQHISGIEAAPYVRLEREQGVEAAQALYARSLQAPPDRKEWDALVSNGCVYVLAHR